MPEVSNDRGAEALRRPGGVLLISCYELGHQPLAVASPLAFLERAGYCPDAMDVAVEPFDAGKAARACFVGISVPMHTALRLGVRVAERVRAVNPGCHLCFYGLYATLNAGYLFERGADSVIGGEFEWPLVALVDALAAGSDAPVSGVVRRGAPVGPGFRPAHVLPTEQQEDVAPVVRLAKRPRPQPVSIARGNGAAGRRNVGPDGSPAPVPRAAGEAVARSDGAAAGRGRAEARPYEVPSRSVLPPLERYARLEINGEQRLAGYVEASRGCKHMCRHCPIPPVYGGRFVVLPRETVLEDVRRLVAMGARHLTFGDPDFLNGPGHALRVTRAVHAAFPELTFDFTAKVEHILKHRTLFPEFAELGCVFMVSAVESLSDRVLAILDKGHTRADVVTALEITRAAGIALRPSFVAFTPWTTGDDYLEVLEFVAAEGLIENVDPVQYAIRLLIPPGSHLLSRPELAPYLGPLVQETFSYQWTHPDPRMDQLHREVSALVESAARAGETTASTFARIWELASSRLEGCRLAGSSSETPRSQVGPNLQRSNLEPPARPGPPRLTEAWFC